MKKLGIGELVLHYAGLIVIFAFVIFPYYWMLNTALKPKADLFLLPPRFWPSQIDFTAFSEVVSRIPFFTYMKNSLIVAGFTTLFAIVISALSGYSIARFSFRGRRKLFGLFVITQLVPGVLPLVPFYFLLHGLGLTNSYAGIIISYATWSIAFCTMMLQSYFRTAYSTEIEESARIDGCNRWGVFFRIALPLARPGIIATSIFAFLLAWNDYIWASIINTKQSYRLISNGIQDFQAQYGNVYINNTMAIGILATIPVLIFFAFAQQHLVSGLSAGAVKG